MTDEERAEENYTKVYLNGDMSLDTEEKYFAYTKGYCKGHTDGLAEGRKENAELKALLERIKKNCLDVMTVQGNNLTDNYMAGMYNGMVVIYNSCFLDTSNELEKSYCSKNKNGKWECKE